MVEPFSWRRLTVQLSSVLFARTATCAEQDSCARPVRTGAPRRLAGFWREDAKWGKGLARRVRRPPGPTAHDRYDREVRRGEQAICVTPGSRWVSLGNDATLERN